MLKKFQSLTGILAYYLCRPLLYPFLNNSHRTRVIIKAEDKFLLIKSWIGNGSWDLPGGGIHKKESAAKGAARELHEETGVHVSSSDLRFVESRKVKEFLITYQANYFYLELDKIPPTRAHWLEVVDIGWFSRKEMNKIRILPAVRRELDSC